MANKKTTTTTTTSIVDNSDAGLAAWGANSSTKYAKLAGKVEYDHEAAEQLADALNEIKRLETMAQQLKQMVEENRELHQFVWQSEDGVIALHKIGDDHLSNIMLHLLRRGSAIPRAIRGEAMHRGLVIPAVVPTDWMQEEKEWAKARMLLDQGDL